jgi:cytidylate kinase
VETPGLPGLPAQRAKAGNLEPSPAAGDNPGFAPKQMTTDFVVAIDGPAGAGKSTVARKVADRLEGFRYLDTGAMYRAVTAYLHRIDNKEASAREMAEAAVGLAVEGDALSVFGIDVTADLRTPEVTADVSRVSAVPEVRRVVQGKQREMRGRLVAEGRDIGTVVFPNAQVKVFLEASLKERSERRHRQYPDQSAAEYAQLIERRDRLDSTREDSPLKSAADAVRIDSTHLTIEEVVEEIAALVRLRLRGGGRARS